MQVERPIAARRSPARPTTSAAAPLASSSPLLAGVRRSTPIDGGRTETEEAARRLGGALHPPAEPLRRRRAGLRRAGGALPVIPPLRLRLRARTRVRRLHRLLRHAGAHARAPPPRPWRQLVGVISSSFSPLTEPLTCSLCPICC